MLGRDMEGIKKTQAEFLEMKIAMPEIKKYTQEGINTLESADE